MSISAIVVTSILLLIGIVDVVLIVLKGKQYSISAWILRHSKAHPVFPFLIGFAMGHLFWRMDTLDIYDCDSEYIEKIKIQCELK